MHTISPTTRTLFGAGVLVVTALAPLGVASPVQAADCHLYPPPHADYPGPAARITFWVSDNYTKWSQSRAQYDASFKNDCQRTTTETNWTVNFNDQISSISNRTGDWWILYEDTDYEGARLCMRPNSHENNIGNDTSFEDKISSVERRGTGQPAGCADVTGTPN